MVAAVVVLLLQVVHVCCACLGYQPVVLVTHSFVAAQPIFSSLLPLVFFFASPPALADFIAAPKRCKMFSKLLLGVDVCGCG